MWRINHQLIKYRFSTLPKSSYFSDYMGLTKQLEALRKLEQKNQRQSVRRLSSMLVMCFAAMGLFMSIAWKQTNLPLHLKLLKTKAKGGILSSLEDKSHQVEDSIEQLQVFIKKSPYEWKSIIAQLFCLTQQATNLQSQSQSIWKQLGSTITEIVSRNNSAKTDLTVHECITLLIQDAILHSSHPKVQWLLCQVLLIHGSIKQVFITLKYCNQYSVTSRIDNKCKGMIKENLRGQTQKDNKHYEIVYERFGPKTYPQILFKQELQSQWLTKIQEMLGWSADWKTQ